MSPVVGENAPPLDGWEYPNRPARRCCGEWSRETHCAFCGHLMPTELRLPPNIVLGSE